MEEEVYLDRPLEIEKEIESLSDIERIAFDKGYITALWGVLEQISDTKRLLLSATIELEDNPIHYNQLLSKVELLDKYESHYRKRVKIIRASMAA